MRMQYSCIGMSCLASQIRVDTAVACVLSYGVCVACAGDAKCGMDGKLCACTVGLHVRETDPSVARSMGSGTRYSD